VRIADLALSSGYSSGFMDYDGGAIYNKENLTLDHVVITHSTAIKGGGIANYGTATLINCTLSGNVGQGGGGGVYNGGTLTLTNCTVSDNTSTQNANGGGISNNSEMTLTNCTLSGNVANEGGGIVNQGQMTLTNCTLAHNSALNSVAIGGNGGGVFNAGGMTLYNCTLAQNSAQEGAGGIYNQTERQAQLYNSIVADNTGVNSEEQDILNGGTVSGSNNLVGTFWAFGGTDALANPIAGDPMLDPAGLKYNGGPTETIALQPDSPAINSGDSSLIPIDPSTGKPYAYDQRGQPHPRVVNGQVDIGAFEYVTPTAITIAFEPTMIAVNGTAKLTFWITNPNDVPLTGISFTDTLPAGLVFKLGTAKLSKFSYSAWAMTQSGLTFGEGALAANSTGTITVDVTSATAGVYNNSVFVTSDETGPTNAVTASLTVVVVSPPMIGMTFDSSVIPLNGTSTLTYTISNPYSNPFPLTGVAFTDTLPDGLVVASSPNVSNNTGGTVTATPGSVTIRLFGGVLAPYSTDTITVAVTGTTVGVKTNIVNVTSATSGQYATTLAAAALTVVDPSHVRYVTNNLDYKSTDPVIPGSLRAALEGANDSDLILFGSPVYNQTIRLYSQIAITKNVTIDTANGQDMGVTISTYGVSGGWGWNGGRDFDITTTGPVSIAHVTLEGNLLENPAIPGPALPGGAIYNRANLTMDHVTVAGGFTNGDYPGGGIYNDHATLTLTNCTVRGGAVEGGGIYDDHGTLTLTASTLEGGATEAGGAIYILDGTAMLTGCTVSGVAGYKVPLGTDPPNPDGLGGGIYDEEGMLTLTNCTVVNCEVGYGDILGKWPGQGAGLYAFNGTLRLTNCTVAFNNANTGSGDAIELQGSGLTLNNNIVARNGTYDAAAGHWIEHDISGSNYAVDSNHDLIWDLDHVDPLFDITTDPVHGTQWLRDNGGPTLTIALQDNSPAIGAGDPAAALDYSTNPPTPLSSDQRGPGYVRFHADGTVDMGAYEQQYVTVSPVPILGDILQSHYGQTGGFHAFFSFAGSPVTVGTVTFLEGGTALTNPIPLDSNGQALFSEVNLPVGVHPITVQYSGSPGFPAASYTEMLTVAPAPLTITANDAGKTYGQAVTFAGTEFTAAGLANDDTVTGVTLSSDGAAASAGVGTYPIVASGAAGSGLGNYDITYVNGTLTVNPAPLTVTANSTSKTYGDTVTFAGTGFTKSGLVNGDTVTGVTLTSAGAPAMAPVAGSPYAIVPSSATGTGLGNYTMTYVSGALTVNKAKLAVTANDAAPIIAGEALPAFTATISGFVNDETSSVLGGALAFSVSPTYSGQAGTYSIIPGGLTASNYDITYVNGTLKVLTYSQATTNLVTRVDGAGLASGMRNSLDSQLQAAIVSFSAGNKTAGRNQLGAFINHVRAQKGKAIDAALADELIAYAQRIITAAS
jgi:uncharacterized repeat protein (TIGR01451 family)